MTNTNDKKIVKIKTPSSWSESYLESLINKAVEMRIFVRGKEYGTVGLDPRFHEIMGEQIVWALESGYNDILVEHLAGCIGKYIIANPSDDPANVKYLPEVMKMAEDKTFQDMCYMIRGFILSATYDDTETEDLK